MKTQTVTVTQKPLNRIATLTAIEADSTTGKMPDRLHLLRVGQFNTEKYGMLDIKAADLQEMVLNFDKGLARPGGGSLGLPVNFRHDKGGIAAAWINGLEFDGKDLWGTDINWSRAGQEAVANQEYKCLSSEFTPRCLGGMWVDPENTGLQAQNVFTGAGLTNIPMFTGNRPVMASAESADKADDDKQVIYINAKAKESKMLTVDALRVKAAADLTDEEKVYASEHKAEFSADEQKRLGLVEASTTTTTTTPKKVDASQVKGDEGMVMVDAAQLKIMNDQIAEVVADNKARKHTEAETVVDAAIEAGKIKADQKDVWVSMIEADASKKDLLEGLQGNASVSDGERGAKGADASDDESATSKLKVAIEAAQKENDKLTYVQAQAQVLASDKDLAAAVDAERAQSVNAGSVK
jgi:hypothetical protein